MDPRCTSSSLKLRAVAAIATLLALLSAPALPAQSPTTLKLAFINIKSGKGQTALPGFPVTFADTSNCTDRTKPLNAWGVGVVQSELLAKVGNDPRVVSLGLAEAWPCATPAAVRAALGWKANSSERNGVAIVARHGFAGPERWTQLDTSLNSNPADTMWVLRVPVCTDAACSSNIVVFTSHWYANGANEEANALTYKTQAQQTVSFMDLVPNAGPQVLLGDLNVFAAPQNVCASVPHSQPQQILADAGYLDAWPSLNGGADGSTGMWNRAGCGTPSGNLFKRIDYAWSRGMSPLSMTRFGMVVPGHEAPSDHAGIIVEYPTPQTLATSGPPTVEIASPAAAATVTGDVTVAVNARDDDSVARVELLLDGRPLAVLWTAPFEYKWSTVKTPNGTHALTAAVTDNAGNRIVSASRTVNVQNSPKLPVPTEIVLHAAKAEKIAGNWVVTPDVTAAGGARLQNQNLGAAKIVTPLASPVSYFEMSFPANAGGFWYRLWIRGKAQNDDYANDSVFVQFDGSVDANGVPMARIGTTAAEGVVVENCGGCGLSGWGWQDNGYGVGVLGAPIFFAESGTQRLRIQIREDGIAIDQIVLSGATYLTASPGAAKNDTTIIPASVAAAVRTRDEIVLYASQAVLVAGAWAPVADGTAAGGMRLQNPDAGAAKLTQAPAPPVNYFDLTFEADAGKPYRLWLRGKAQNDFYLNDSVFIQFDRSVDAAGLPIGRIGTTSAEIVVLEDCGGCALSGWGWQDNGYGPNTLGPTIRFAQSGLQRMRILVREDGLAIDQVVLSAVKYLSASPGALRNDTTVLPK